MRNESTQKNATALFFLGFSHPFFPTLRHPFFYVDLALSLPACRTVLEDRRWEAPGGAGLSFPAVCFLCLPLWPCSLRGGGASRVLPPKRGRRFELREEVRASRARAHLSPSLSAPVFRWRTPGKVRFSPLPARVRGSKKNFTLSLVEFRRGRRGETFFSFTPFPFLSFPFFFFFFFFFFFLRKKNNGRGGRPGLRRVRRR